MKVKALVIIFSAAAVALLSIGLYWVLIGESEEDRLEAFIRQIAEEMPDKDGQDYLAYVDLDQYGFRLRLRGYRQSFGKDDEELFIKMADGYARSIRGSRISITSIEIEITDALAKVRMTSIWHHSREDSILPDGSMIDFTAQFVKSGESWKCSRLEGQPSRNLIDRLKYSP